MATILTRQGKYGTSFVIHYYGNDRKSRFYLCLGQKYRRRQAEEIKILVENLLDAAATKRRLYPEEEEALRRLPKNIKRRIAEKGLLKGFQFLSIGEIWDRYIEEVKNDPNKKKGTAETYHSAYKRFFDYFEPDDEPDDIELEDGNNCRDWLEDSLQLAEATAANSVVRTRTVFSWARKNGYCQNNIFLDVRKGSMENKDKEFYIPIPWYERLLTLCPDQEWRTYLALMRLDGVRSGEARVLAWDAVLWDEDKVRIVSPKTERFKGHDERIIPMFKRLQQEFRKLFEVKGRPTSGPVLPDLHHDRTQKPLTNNLRERFSKPVSTSGRD